MWLFRYNKYPNGQYLICIRKYNKNINKKDIIEKQKFNYAYLLKYKIKSSINKIVKIKLNWK